MKLGLVIYGSLDTVSGGYLYDRMLVSHLRQQGDEVEIISVAPGNYLRNLLDNLTFRLDGNFDIVLQDELCHPSLLVENAREHPCPTISIVHNLRSEHRLTPQGAFYRIVERGYLGRVDGFIFNSRATCDSVFGLTRARPPHVIASPGGDRLGEFRADAIELRANRDGPLRLVFLGNVLPGKGLNIVLDALQRLPGTSASLDVVGSCDVDPGYARRMQAQASRLGMPVFFHGVLDNQSLTAVLQHAHALVLPSQYEGFGIAYLEGMAFGLPALGTDSGAIPELISDGIDGFLISRGDAIGLSNYLARLAGDRRLLARMGLAALKKYRSRPTWSASTKLIREFLAGLVERKGSAGAKGQRQRARS